MEMISQGSNVPEETLICLSIVNIGNRKLIINQWGFDYHNKTGHALLGFNQSALIQLITPTLPRQLDVEDRIDLYLERKFFIKSLKEGIEKKKLSKSKKVSFFVTDSTGKIYRVKSQRTVFEMIND